MIKSTLFQQFFQCERGCHPSCGRHVSLWNLCLISAIMEANRYLNLRMDQYLIYGLLDFYFSFSLLKRRYRDTIHVLPFSRNMVWVGLFVLIGTAGSVVAEDGENAALFTRRIAPLFREKCLACRGEGKEARESGLDLLSL